MLFPLRLDSILFWLLRRHIEARLVDVLRGVDDRGLLLHLVHVHLLVLLLDPPRVFTASPGLAV